MSKSSPNKRTIPAISIKGAIERAGRGENPGIDTEQMLTMLGLATDEPDGRNLLERFTDDRTSLSNTFRGVRLLLAAKRLINTTNEYGANPAQEAIAASLGAVVTRQITREEEICGAARDVALTSTRDDIISPEIRASLSGVEIVEEEAEPEIAHPLEVATLFAAMTTLEGKTDPDGGVLVEQVETDGPGRTYLVHLPPELDNLPPLAIDQVLQGVANAQAGPCRRFC